MSRDLGNSAVWEGSGLAFLHRQIFDTVRPLPPGTNLKGKTAIVTGSNIGLGLECCKLFLSLQISHLILAVRSQAKGEAAAEGLRKQFPDQVIDVWILDMASYESVQAFASRCEGLERLDMVILNASVISKPYFERVPETGHNDFLQVNYLSTALLTFLLIPILKSKRKEQEPGRITIVTSEVAHWDTIASANAASSRSPLALLDDPTGYEPMKWYQLTKLFQVMFVETLAGKISADEVIVNSSQPGFCWGTGMAREAPAKAWLVMKGFTAIIGRIMAVGVRQYADAVISKGRESHGSYLSDGKIKPYPVFMYTEEGKMFQEKLWDETLQALPSFAKGRTLKLLAGEST